MRRWPAATALPVVLMTVALVGGCRERSVSARWRDRPVTVDGQDLEWADARVATGDARFGLGLMNDSTALFLSVRLADSTAQQQVLTGGLTIWLDPRGGKAKTYGVRFPVTRLETLRPQDVPAEGFWQDDSTPLASRFASLLESAKMEVIGPGAGQERRLPPGGDPRVQVAARFDRGSLVYEARLSLAGLDAAPGSRIGLGLETQQAGFGGPPRREGGPMGMGDGPGGMGGGPPGGMDGPPPGGMEGGPPGGMDGGPPAGMGLGVPQPLELWAKVRLASPAAGAASP